MIPLIEIFSYYTMARSRKIPLLGGRNGVLVRLRMNKGDICNCRISEKDTVLDLLKSASNYFHTLNDLHGNYSSVSVGVFNSCMAPADFINLDLNDLVILHVLSKSTTFCFRAFSKCSF